MSPRLRFGIDLGGTKIEIIGLESGDSGQSDQVYQKRVLTPKGDYSATLEILVELVLEAESVLKKLARSVSVFQGQFLLELGGLKMPIRLT